MSEAAIETADAVGNDERGEHELTLKGRKFRLRPSFEAVQAIEKKTGHALLKLYAMCNVGDLSYRQLGIVAGEMIRAGADEEMVKNYSDEGVAQMIFESGTLHVGARLTICLGDVASGGRKASGEAKAVAGS